MVTQNGWDSPLPIPPSLGGTGVANNNASTIGISGNHSLTLTLSGTTGVTLPTSGTLATVTSASFPITPYVVGPIGFAGYQTIQSALDAANAAGIGAIYIMPGQYTENLTLYPTSQIIGATFNTGSSTDSVFIFGVHVPPTTGLVSFTNIYLDSASDIFNSGAAGNGSISIDNCTVLVNGYIFNLSNWRSGIFELRNINDQSAQNAIIANAVNISILNIYNSVVGIGTANTMTTGATVNIENSQIGCPVDMINGSGEINFDSSVFTQSVSLNGFTAQCTNCSFLSGSTTALFQQSTNPLVLNNCVIDSSAVPVIDGSGSGALILNNVSFLTNSGIANTLTLKYPGTSYPSSLQPNFIMSMKDDFLNWSNNDNALPGSFKVVISESGTWWEVGQLNTSTFKAAIASHPGLITHGTLVNTQSWGLAQIQDQNGGTVYPILLSTNQVSINWVFQITEVSGTSATFTVEVGFTGGAATEGVPTTAGIWFSYDISANSGLWTLNSMDATTLTTVNTTTALDTAAFHNFEIVFVAGGGTVNFYIDGVLQGSITTNIPTTSISPYFSIDCNDVVNTLDANVAIVDLVYMSEVFTTPR